MGLGIFSVKISISYFELFNLVIFPQSSMVCNVKSTLQTKTTLVQNVSVKDARVCGCRLVDTKVYFVSGGYTAVFGIE